MQQIIPVGLSMPREIIQRIDSDRGDVSRSRYVLRMVLRFYGIEVLEDKQKQRKIKKQPAETTCQPQAQPSANIPGHPLEGSRVD